MMHNKTSFRKQAHKFDKFGLLVCVALLFSCAQEQGEQQQQAEQQQPWSEQMAESIMMRHPNLYADWDYVTGTVLKGFEELWRHTGEQRYYDYIEQTVDSVVNADGSIDDYKLSDYNIDEINEGRMLLLLYKETGQEKYKKAADLLRSQLADQPRNSRGGFWHKQRYPYQMWLDGLYMGAPFYTEYGKLFDQPQNFDDVVNQFVLIEKYTRDPQTGLLYHAWDEKKEQEWADPATGLSKIFWGRAMGWYAMALVDVLDYLPENHAGRDELIAILQRLAVAVARVQDEDSGVWWQVVDQPRREGNYLEASVSCMFTYALAKGVRHAYLDTAYKFVARKAFQGIIDNFIAKNPDGTIDLTQICRSAGLGYGRDGSYDYYVYQEERVENDGKGTGPFIMASLELERMK